MYRRYLLSLPSRRPQSARRRSPPLQPRHGAFTAARTGGSASTAASGKAGACAAGVIMVTTVVPDGAIFIHCAAKAFET